MTKREVLTVAKEKIEALLDMSDEQLEKETVCVVVASEVVSDDGDKAMQVTQGINCKPGFMLGVIRGMVE